MQWLETEVLPAACRQCRKEDCYHCENAEKRWHLSQEDALRLRRMGLQRAINRLRRQLLEVDAQLKALEQQRKISKAKEEPGA